jgi:peptidoglycan-associated lipoprotein
MTSAGSNVTVDPAIASACELPNPTFGFDSSTMQSSTTLDLLARCFVSGPMQKRGLRLVGHADPRGETEYNLGLGQRRAGSIQRYLVDRGVAAGRIASSSQGEFAAKGHDEASWAADRRVDVLLAN